jgi:zinc D-Ala-D-Ala dipeptidase
MIYPNSVFERKILEPYEVEIRRALCEPVPDLSLARQAKIGYQEFPINNQHPLFNEPIVNLDTYARLAGQSYYSRSNIAGQAAPGVAKDVFVRESVAYRLCALNQFMALPVITEFFNGEVELFVQDGLRPVSLQKSLYYDFYPKLIREQYPGISDEDLQARLSELAAKPSTNPLRPSPHTTGGCFDVTIRYIQTDPYFIEDKRHIEFAHPPGDVRKTVYLDYYENNRPVTKQEKLGRKNRRALNAIMTGRAFNWPTGFVVNPTELWHWGMGDQLSEKVRGEDEAYYSFVE